MSGRQWDEIAKPILDFIVLAEPSHAPTSEQIAKALGKPHQEVTRQLRSLRQDGYLTADPASGEPLYEGPWSEIELLARGRRAVGEWPGQPGEECIKRLDRMIAAAEDPEEAKKLNNLKGAAKAVGLAALSGVIEASAQGVF